MRSSLIDPTLSIAVLMSVGTLMESCSSGESSSEATRFMGADVDSGRAIDGGESTAHDAADTGLEEVDRVTCSVTPCVTDLAARGGAHVCAILSDRTVRCWGANASGQLGGGIADDGGASTYGAKPVVVLNIDSAVQLSVSGNDNTGTACALLETGRVKCWGSNVHGQLALDAETPIVDNDLHPTPTTVEGLPFVKRVDLAATFACAVGSDSEDVTNGKMYCWGWNSVLQLGRGYTPREHGVVGEVKLEDKATAGAGTKVNGFSLTVDGKVRSWGESLWQNLPPFSGIPPIHNALGRESSIIPDGTPTEIPGLVHVSGIAAGYEHACAVGDGIVHCWGGNSTRAVGNSSTVDVRTPYSVTIANAGLFKEVAVSNTTSCARDTHGAVYCWGDNRKGQLGGGNAEIALNPVVVSQLSGRAVRVVAMDQATCALMEDGSVQCWGDNSEGQLGLGNKDDRPHYVPQRVEF